MGIATGPSSPQTGLGNVASGLASEYLVTLGRDGRVQPGIAGTWERADGGKRWIFKMENPVTFHDGTVADARVLAEVLKKAVRNPQNALVHPGLGQVEDVVAAGRDTIAVTSRTPRLLLIDELSDIALQKEGTGGSLGPFIREMTTPEELRVRAFGKYFRGRPQLDEVTYQTYRSVRAAWAALMRDEVDVLHEVTRDAHEFVASERRVRTHSFVRPYVATVLFNVNRTALRDPSVRRALVASVDRAAILSDAYRGRGRPASGPLFPDHWTLAATEAVTAPFNPASADAALRRLPLSKAADRMPSRLRFTCLVLVGIEHQPFERIALLLQQQLYARGIDMQIEAVSPAELPQRILKGRFDAALFEFFGRSPSWLYAFWHSRAAAFGGLIGGGYSAADSELDAMHLAKDEEKLKGAVAAVYRKMQEDPPAIFIAWPEVTRAVSTRFEVPVEQGRDVLGANLWRWRPAGQR